MQKIVLTLAGVLAATAFAPEAAAVPAFARQTGMACNACHFQAFPALNAFGRSFKSSGYTLGGSQSNIDGANMSLPSTLNASLVTKLQYVMTDSDASGRGEIVWPDEAALLVGGRAAEHVGFLAELGLNPQEAEVTGTCADAVAAGGNGDGICNAGEAVSSTGDTTGNFLSFKAVFNATDNASVVLFGTDGLGAGYGFELLNTGFQRSQRPIENRSGMSAYQTTGLGSGSATGLALVYHTDSLYVNYSHWAPTFGNVNAKLLGGLGHLVRVGYMPSFGDWDVGIGATMMSGVIKAGASDPAAEVEVKGTGFDAQAQGTLGGMSAGFFGSYAVAPTCAATTDVCAYGNASGGKDKKGMAVLGKLGVMEGLNAYLGYSTLKTTGTDKRTTIGVQYALAQNINVELFRESRDNAGTSSSTTKLQMFAGF